jgi:hypothetical protein
VDCLGHPTGPLVLRPSRQFSNATASVHVQPAEGGRRRRW